MKCKECGGTFKKIGGVDKTAKYQCSECFVEIIKFVQDECDHEYNGKNMCIHCGESE